MKKWWILPIAVGAVVAAIAVNRTDSPTVPVQTEVLRTESVEQTVSCNGVIEAGEVTGVFVPQACVAGEVSVTVGQRVRAGDPLITIDKELTKQMQLSDNRLSEALSLTTMADTITAPCDGIVLSVEAIKGTVVEATAPCVTIAAISDLQVRVLIREKQLPRLEIGQAVRISGAGFDKTVYRGRLDEIAGAASSSSGGESVVEGVVVLDEGEADASMRIGLSAKAKVVISSVDEGLLIPFEAIVEEDDVSYVYFVEDGRAVRETIDSIGEFSGGVLVSRTDWNGRRIVLEPDKIEGDGVVVSVVQEDDE